MTYRADQGMAVGHVHLKVSDLERSIAFYTDVLGFDVMDRMGDQAAFLSVGGYHHHIALNTWQSEGGPRPAYNATGLYHVAFVFPTRAALGAAVENVATSGVKILGAADHGVSNAVYFNDPDGNGIELYWDRPRAEWPRDADGKLAISSGPLDVAALRRERFKQPVTQLS